MIEFHDLHRVDPDTVEAWTDLLSVQLKQSDLDEIAATSSLTPCEALHWSVKMSTHAWAIVTPTEGVIAMFGAAPTALEGVGSVWMLGSDHIQAEALGIARATPRYLDVMGETYPILWNHIDDRNKVSMKWLKWGGFKVLSEKFFGPHKFHLFARTTPCVSPSPQ